MISFNYQFIEGLLKLEYNANEYIERQIRRIISFYLPLYVNRSNAYISLKVLSDDLRGMSNH